MEGEAPMVDLDRVFKDLIFLNIVGIQDSLRYGVATAMKACQRLGVFVRMVTGDNVLRAKAIAEDCGILVPGGLVMEGPTFRKLSKREMGEIIPKLCVLARSSPEEMRTLVRRLKVLEETIAVSGDGTNDAPALRAADVELGQNDRYQGATLRREMWKSLQNGHWAEENIPSLCVEDQ